MYKVNAEKFNKWQRVKRAASALDKRAKEMAKEMGLPESSQFDGPAAGVIVDGNGQPIGKFSVFNYPGAQIPAGLRVKIS